MGADTYVRHNSDFRNSLILDYGNQRRLNLSASKQLSTTRGRGIGQELCNTTLFSMLKTPEKWRRI